MPAPKKPTTPKATAQRAQFVQDVNKLANERRRVDANTTANGGIPPMVGKNTIPDWNAMAQNLANKYGAAKVKNALTAAVKPAAPKPPAAKPPTRKK